MLAAKTQSISMELQRTAWSVALIAALAGCATPDDVSRTTGPALSAEEARTLVRRLLPDHVADLAGWSTDVYAAIAVLEIAPTAENFCAAIAVTEQESGFRVDPTVPGLSAIAWKEIDRQRASAGIPKVVLDTALALPSSNGRSYAERLDEVKTELQLSDLFEDFIGRVPLGKTFLADRNPVRTGGPMQVSIAFAQAQTEGRGYPYPVVGSIRREVFTRRGGMYFGIAHLLDYPAAYDRPLYRFADFNAGRYASRNAAFQNAVTQASGVPLVLDGDLLRYEDGRPAKEAGNTELAVRALARRLDLSAADIRNDLELGKGSAFERTALYKRVFALAERTTGKPLPRAVVPQILLRSPKITRKLTTEWFANRVNDRYERCLRRSRGAS
jgi:Protein of unknown function (DUF1615)